MDVAATLVDSLTGGWTPEASQASKWFRDQAWNRGLEASGHQGNLSVARLSSSRAQYENLMRPQISVQ
ncbi:hypothetical protein AXG93_3256s1490 [Marchantia polymorpha subsp. ruderalis]|uniref:Uncharacterized protein n=1 Tax=Marchantia polymorpha subsp. ruderalis TaxID=1480154 RepID=A0A176VKP2_MARPO|nr:hypothetical protein AXG93_3256s1490 [Marchantia polymorpha subsp. ruderalis]